VEPGGIQDQDRDRDKTEVLIWLKGVGLGLYYIHTAQFGSNQIPTNGWRLDQIKSQQTS
jgi:hypothetical protein